MVQTLKGKKKINIFSTNLKFNKHSNVHQKEVFCEKKKKISRCPIFTMPRNTDTAQTCQHQLDSYALHSPNYAFHIKIQNGNEKKKGCKNRLQKRAQIKLNMQRIIIKNNNEN